MVPQNECNDLEVKRKEMGRWALGCGAAHSYTSCYSSDYLMKK